MKLTLPRFGSEEVEVDPASLIEFPSGLPGFDACRRFKLFHADDNLSVFWLQSVDDLLVAFPLSDPGLFKLAYNLTLSDDEEDILRITDGDELQIAVTLSQQAEGQSAVRPNLRSPIIINVTKRTALQKSLLNSELPTAYS